MRYFDVQGAAETIRYVMALGGCEWTEEKWPVDFSKFKDGITAACPPFGAACAAGELDTNLGRAPVVIIDGLELGQSKSIEKYLARRLGVMGGSDFEAAQIDMFTEHIRDLKDKYQKAKGEPEKKAEFFEKTMPEFMGKIEKSLPPAKGSSGAVIGKSLSLADVTLYVFVKDFFTDKAAASASLSKAPRLTASIEAVDKHPGIVKYLAGRTYPAT